MAFSPPLYVVLLQKACKRGGHWHPRTLPGYALEVHVRSDTWSLVSGLLSTQWVKPIYPRLGFGKKNFWRISIWISSKVVYFFKVCPDFVYSVSCVSIQKFIESWGIPLRSFFFWDPSKLVNSLMSFSEPSAFFFFCSKLRMISPGHWFSLLVW